VLLRRTGGAQIKNKDSFKRESSSLISDKNGGKGYFPFFLFACALNTHFMNEANIYQENFG
jgi:hypothetical protein